MHVRARRNTDGVRIAFIRRARRDADAWEPVGVPLGEDGERYEVDILAGAAVLHTLATAVPEALYPAAQELADFGTAQSSLSLRVVQLGSRSGADSSAP